MARAVESDVREADFWVGKVELLRTEVATFREEVERLQEAAELEALVLAGDATDKYYRAIRRSRLEPEVDRQTEAVARAVSDDPVTPTVLESFRCWLQKACRHFASAG